MARIPLVGQVPGSVIRVQVRASDGDIKSAWSVASDISVDRTALAPAAPDGVTFNSVGNDFVAAWTAVTLDGDGTQLFDLRGYEVQFSVSGKPTLTKLVTDTRYVLSLAENIAAFGTAQPSVSFRVRSVDVSGNRSAWSGTFTATNPAPAAPTNFTAQGAIESVNLKWTPSVDVDVSGYRIYASKVDGFSTNASNLVRQVSGRDTNSVIWDTTDTGVMWYFKIEAVDVFGTASTQVQASATPRSALQQDTTAPNPITNLSVSSAFDTDAQRAYATLSWTASTSTNVRDYIVYYGTGTTEPTTFEQVVVPKDQTSVRIQVAAGRPYYFSVRARSEASVLSTVVKDSTYPRTMAADVVAPSQPAAPSVSVSIGNMTAQVTAPTLKQAGGNLESDVKEFRVHAFTTSGFTASAANMIGKIAAGGTQIETFYLPATDTSSTWYFRVVAVDFSNNASTASNTATGVIGLIGNSNIQNATITSAKIKSLTADKITAGSGIITELVIADGTHPDTGLATSGVLRSSDFLTGTRGWRLDKTGFELNVGTIRAPGLEILNTKNLIPSEYASFEKKKAYFEANLSPSYMYWDVGYSTDDKPAYIGSQYFASIFGNTGTTVARIDLAPDQGTHNVRIAPGEKYIVSAYVRTAGGTTTTVRLGFATDDGQGFASANFTPTTGSVTWQRVSFVVTAPVAATMGHVYVESPTTASGAGFDVDGVMVERWAGTDTPSAFVMPSNTYIDGSRINTGTITSDNISTEYAEAIEIKADRIMGGVMSSTVSLSGEFVTFDPAEPKDVTSYSITNGIAKFTVVNHGITKDWWAAFYGVDGATTPANINNFRSIYPDTNNTDIFYAELKDYTGGNVAETALTNIKVLFTSQRRVSMSGEGIQGLQPNGNTAFTIPTSLDELVEFSGKVNTFEVGTETLTISKTAALGAGAVLEIQGTPQAPISGPTLTQGLLATPIASTPAGYAARGATYDRYIVRFIQTFVSGGIGYWRGLAADGLAVSTNQKFVPHIKKGGQYFPGTTRELCSVVRLDNDRYFGAFKWHSNTSGEANNIWRIGPHQINSPDGSWPVLYSNYLIACGPYLNNPDHFLTANINTDNKLVITKWSGDFIITGGYGATRLAQYVLANPFVTSNSISSVAYENRGTGARYWVSAGTEVKAYTPITDANGNHTGMTYDPLSSFDTDLTTYGGGVFAAGSTFNIVQIMNTGNLKYQYSNYNYTDNAAPHHVAYEYATETGNGGLHTGLGPSSTIVLKKRRYISMSLATRPSLTNYTLAFINKSATPPALPGGASNFVRVGNTNTNNLMLYITDGTQPGSPVNTFGPSPAAIRAGTGGFILRGDSTGSTGALTTARVSSTLAYNSPFTNYGATYGTAGWDYDPITDRVHLYGMVNRTAASASTNVFDIAVLPVQVQPQRTNYHRVHGVVGSVNGFSLYIAKATDTGAPPGTLRVVLPSSQVWAAGSGNYVSLDGVSFRLSAT